MSKIEKRLEASVRLDAFNGDAGERNVCVRQVVEAIATINDLRRQLAAAQAENERLTSERDHTQARYDALRITSETTIGQLRQQIVHLKDRVTELEAGIVSFLDCAMRNEATLLKEGDKAGWWDTNALTPLCEIGDKLVDFGKWEIHPDGYGRRQFYRPIEVDARKEPT